LTFVPRPAAGQSRVFDVQLRPFVTGIIPVVGRNGAVGGVSIDAEGVLARTSAEQSSRLREARLQALAEMDREIGRELTAPSKMRKVSLRRLAAALEERRRQGLPPTDELQNLAGLARVEYVFVDPQARDIVLAGPAEGWTVNAEGQLVGRTSGEPPLQLDDLVVALRAARDQLTTHELITCSIDPTEEGARRFSRQMKSQGANPTPAAIARLEAAAGPQQITITGIPPGSRFAHVLVSADYAMKRLGMNLEKSPVDGLPSYLELLQADSAPAPQRAMPRWWMTPRYKPLLRDSEGLAWQLRGPGVQTLSEESPTHRGAAGVAVTAKANTPVRRWADAMTDRFSALAAKLPVFAELRNCMDLAVIGALFVKEDLPARAGCDLGLLLDEQRLAVAEYHVPRTLAAQASLIRKDRQWIISVSGGVEIDSWSVLDQVEVDRDLAEVRTRAVRAKPERWWWD
jgi:hypothetical protein